MKLLFYENLSPKLTNRLSDLFPIVDTAVLSQLCGVDP